MFLGFFAKTDDVAKHESATQKHLKSASPITVYTVYSFLNLNMRIK